MRTSTRGMLIPNSPGWMLCYSSDGWGCDRQHIVLHCACLRSPIIQASSQLVKTILQYVPGIIVLYLKLAPIICLQSSESKVYLHTAANYRMVREWLPDAVSNDTSVHCSQPAVIEKWCYKRSWQDRNTDCIMGELLTLWTSMLKPNSNWNIFFAFCIFNIGLAPLM